MRGDGFAGPAPVMKYTVDAPAPLLHGPTHDELMYTTGLCHGALVGGIFATGNRLACFHTSVVYWTVVPYCMAVFFCFSQHDCRDWNFDYKLDLHAQVPQQLEARESLEKELAQCQRNLSSQALLPQCQECGMRDSDFLRCRPT